MTEPVVVVDKALAAVGASAADLGGKEGGTGPTPPPAPSNVPPPAVDPVAEKAAADKAAADAVTKAAEDAKAAAEAEDKPLDTAVWGTTGSEVGDSVLELIQNSGMTQDDAKAIMFEAVKSGDLSKIDRDALVEKVGKAKATLILAGAQNFINDAATKNATIIGEVHTTVGGKENWDALTTWAKANVGEADLSDYRAMIDAGGAKARFAAAELASKYNADPKNTTLSSAKTTEIIGDTKATSTARALNKSAYYAEINAAYARGATPSEIAEINAARAAGRAKGL